MSHDEFSDLFRKNNPFLKYLNEKEQEVLDKIIQTPNWNWYGNDSWIYDGPPPKILETDDSCNHQWKDYIGLNEQFTYCSKCDKKKDV